MEEKSIAMAILGIVAVIAVVGLVLLFKSATGMGLYGGEMRQGESILRPIGEEPARYTSPVPVTEGGTYYQHREGWEGLERDPCPDKNYPVATTANAAGARDDCIPSTVKYGIVCCMPAGRAYAQGMYE
ncbi:MAG: hypothetical protein QXT19_03385 [Candidatus Woesearchaeota archaeon]